MLDRKAQATGGVKQRKFPWQMKRGDRKRHEEPGVSREQTGRGTGAKVRSGDHEGIPLPKRTHVTLEAGRAKTRSDRHLEMILPSLWLISS